MIESLTEKLMAWCERRGRVLRITGSGGPDDIYLIRYYVVKSKWFNVFIHQFLRSDRDDVHDHPWSFLTYLVRGAYTEKKWNETTQSEDTTRRYSGGNALVFVRDYGTHAELMDQVNLRIGIKPKNRLVFRRATDQHKVLTDHSYKLSEKMFAPLTICVTGPAVREWGFVKDTFKLVDGDFDGVGCKVYQHAGRRWVPWREYLDLPADEPGRG